MKKFVVFILILLHIPLVAQVDSLPFEPTQSFYGTSDWLIDASKYKAGVYKNLNSNEIVISNGLIRRVFLIKENAATISFENLITGESVIRGIKPEGEISINGVHYEIGGLKGQPNYAYFNRDWIKELKNDSSAFQFVAYSISEPQAPFEWKRVRHHRKDSPWPPKGIHLSMDYKLIDSQDLDEIKVTVHYELYDGLPVLVKWISLKNNSGKRITINSFTSEILAAIEYASIVEFRGVELPKPNIHIETDYAFSGMTAENSNNHVVHWEIDPDFHTQVNYRKLTPCLLKVKPELGPEIDILPNQSFKSFRTFVKPRDSYDRERNGLAQRRMYRTLAPWTNENPLMMHARFADWEKVKIAIDQCAEVGFEMVILTFGSGFNIEDESEEYVEKMKGYAEYANSKGIEIGGYSLLASRKVGGGNDVVMPENQSPTFGNSPCIGSEWGQNYFRKLYNFFDDTGFNLLEHDGSYPGDICISTSHPGHKGYGDSRWTQYSVISQLYRWCREKGIYLNVPDYYYLAGSNKSGMGYREVNWSLPREQQLIHTRQNIYDGTWTKTPSMGWMFVPLTEYHGGGDAATIEPLNEHIDHYRNMIAANFGGGVQACYRGPRLYDTEETKAMVKEHVDWYKKHREVLEGDIIHLRRPDGRDIDYWLNINPEGLEKGMLLVFNPLDDDITKTIDVPLYYTGLTDKVIVQYEDNEEIEYNLMRDYSINIEINVKANSYTWIVFK